MRHPLRRSVATVLLLPPLFLAAATPAAARDRGHGGHGRDDGRELPAAFTLSGDPGGSQFEGIAVAPGREVFYVTETTGGEIHRGDIDNARTQVWIDQDDALRDGRLAAAGIATDRGGRVYVAGGSNRTQPGAAADAPDFWVYDDDGDLQAALRMPVPGGVFLNDVVIGPDDAAYVTDSVTPRIFRIVREHGDWHATLWADAAGPPIYQTGPFGLNGIEVAPDGQSLVVAQSDAGALWRFDLETRTATRIETGDVDLTMADGLVVTGHTLVAVRNTPHILTYLRLAEDASTARLVAEVPTDAERVFTTGDVVRGRLLIVDSQFDEAPPSRDSEVVSVP